MIDRVQLIPLRVWKDDRGWLYELRRDSALPAPTRQTNRTPRRLTEDRL